RVEDSLHDGQHVLVHGDGLVEFAEGEQGVDADGSGTLEAVVGRLDVEAVLEASQVGGERVDELGLDGALEDRVAVTVDGGDVLVDGEGVEHDPRLPSAPWPSTRSVTPCPTCTR